MEHLIRATIESNLRQVRERIAQAAQQAGRDPDEVRLIVVTKGHPVETVREAIAAGATDLGENYIEEALGKIEETGAAEQATWHMIGHVQSRKAQAASQHFAWVHTMDSARLANRLDRFAREAGRRLPALLECNVSGEASKFGWPAWQEDDWEGLLPEVGRLLALENLQVRGLMTMAPFLEDPEAARPFFRRLRRLQEFFQSHFPGAQWGELSMGMSADYPAAVMEGATMVRIGTAILGSRPGR